MSIDFLYDVGHSSLFILEKYWLFFHVSSLANLEDLVADPDAVENTAHDEKKSQNFT